MELSFSCEGESIKMSFQNSSSSSRTQAIILDDVVMDNFTRGLTTFSS